MFKLINDKTQEEIKPGATVTTFRGESLELVSFSPPHKPSSSGHIVVRDASGEREYYPSVINAHIVEV